MAGYTSLGPRLVWLGCPVQLEVEEVASTSNTSTPKALVDIGRAPSASPKRPRACVYNTHTHYMSDVQAGMLGRGILIRSSCMKGGRPSVAVQALRLRGGMEWGG